MLKMFPSRADSERCPSVLPKLAGAAGRRGMGLLTALFIIVVVGMFGTLLGRYLTISSVSSAEDYSFAQALYSAQGAAQLAILHADAGGGGAMQLSSLAGFTTSVTGIVSGVRSEASKEIDGRPVVRRIELHYSL